MEGFKVVLIGCGRISKNHMKAMADNQKYGFFAGLCDLILSRAEERQKEYLEYSGIEAKVYTDYKKMLTELHPDVAVVSTESGNHFEVGMEALKAGCHILMEKPICMTMEEANALCALGKEKHLTIGTCHQNRFNPAVKKLRRAVEEGRFGRIHSITARILWTRDDHYYQMASWRGTEAQDGGTLMNQCIHNIDLLRWMMGSDVERISAERARFMRPIEMEDFGAALIRFKNKGIGIVEGSAVVYPKNLEETLSVFGEKGTVVLGGKAVNKVEVWDFADEKAYDRENFDQVIENIYGSGHTPLYEDFFLALKEGRQPLVSGDEGRKSIGIVLGIYEASAIEA